MERGNLLLDIDVIAHRAWEDFDVERLEALCGDQFKRKLIAKSQQAEIFEKILGYHMYNERRINGRLLETDPYFESLKDLLLVFRRRKVFERYPHNRRPRLDSVFLDGMQISRIFNYGKEMDKYQEILESEKRSVMCMTEAFIQDFSKAPIVANDTKIWQIVTKFTF